MAGHSKWAQIKRKKAVADAKRGALFGKLARAISVAARGNPDPATNLRLKGEVERARAVNMPADSIDRAIRRVTEKESATLEEVTIEIVGPAGSAIIAQGITDNTNRTVHEVKQLATKHGARMAGEGSLLWMFRVTGIIRIPIAGQDEAALQLAAIDAGATDVSLIDGFLVVACEPADFERVRGALPAPASEATLELIPTTTTPLPSPADQEKLGALMDALDDLEDIQHVFTNADY
jgi:YebC/PmpR family DNA-binding regulatory protein